MDILEVVVEYFHPRFFPVFALPLPCCVSYVIGVLYLGRPLDERTQPPNRQSKFTMGSESSERHTQSVGGSLDIETKHGITATGKADAALEFLRDIAVITEVDEKALVRNIDWMIMPLVWGAYNLQYLDKVLSR